MTDVEYEKALLLAKIEAQRSIFVLETRLARATVDPWHAMLSFVGVDGSVAGAVATSVRTALAGRHEGVGLGAVVSLLVAALLPLVEGLRAREEHATDDPSREDDPGAAPE